MIIEMLLEVIYKLMSLLMVFSIPSLPDSVQEMIDSVFTYIVAGAGLLANYTPFSYLMTLFFLLLAIDAGIMVYHFVMWIIKKIPMLGVS